MFGLLALVDMDIFYFFCSGEGKGQSEAPGGGVGGAIFFLGKIPGRGGGLRVGGGGGSGGCLRGIWGGGALNIFFRAEIPTKLPS